MDIETAVRSFVAWLLWCEGLQLHLTGRHDNETLWIQVLSKTAEMSEDKAKKTGKDEIDGWNIGEWAGEGRGGRRGEKGTDTELKQQGVQKLFFRSK